MAASERQGVLLREFDQPLVIAGVARQRRAGRFAESNAESHSGNGLNNCLMQVFDGFDEMRLAEDEIHVGRFFDGDSFKFHFRLHLQIHPQITQITQILARRTLAW
jgi:hypothetical protein